MLNSDDLAAFQADKVVLEDANEITMTTSVVVQSKTLTPNGAGGYTESWTATVTVAGRIQQVTPSDLPAVGNLAAARPEKEMFKVTLPRGTSVNSGQRLVSDGRTFEVLGVIGGLTWEVGTKVIAVEYGS